MFVWAADEGFLLQLLALTFQPLLRSFTATQHEGAQGLESLSLAALAEDESFEHLGDVKPFRIHSSASASIRLIG